ncbi:Major facilitator superfamily [Trinorchestia longiramus]|nr:Major facilitator superfamily [Trinorchestia longiramus]
MARPWTKMLEAVRATTLEPVMFIEGATINAMVILMENVQMFKTCTNTLDFPNEVCYNLVNHTEENIAVQKELSVFIFYDSIILSVVSFLFILFMGAWSDVYGRKFPLLLMIFCRVINAAGYLLALIVPSLPAQFIYGVTFFMSLGGGYHGLVSMAFSYASDITSEGNRTIKITIFSSLWYLGGPIGTSLTGLVLNHSTYSVALSIMLGLNIFVFFYIIFIVKESCGPFAKIGNCLTDPTMQRLKKENVSYGRMVVDFINWRRVVESFHTLFKPRPGDNRALLLTSVGSNMARWAAKCCFLYLFTRRVLGWEAGLYSYWTTYRFLVTAVCTMGLVPLLSKFCNASDYMLIAWGSVSAALEFILYALVLSPSLVPIMWVSPVMGFLTDAQIALRSFTTKIVDPDEKGRITAATGALTNLARLAGHASYTLIYRETVEYYPGAQFIFSASVNMTIAIVFFALDRVKRGAKQVEEKHGSESQRKMSNTISKKTMHASTHEAVLPKKAEDMRNASLSEGYGSVKPAANCESAEALEDPHKS